MTGLGEPPDPADFTEPYDWVMAVREAGGEVPDSLKGAIYRLVEDGTRDLSQALTWLHDRGMLSQDGLIYQVEDTVEEATALAVRAEREQKLPDARCEDDGDSLTIHFPESEDLQPIYGFMYTTQPDGSLEEVGWAKGTLRVPRGATLSLQAMNPGDYGRPFRGLPADLIDEVFCTAWEHSTDRDMEAFADLPGIRVVNLGYLYPEGLIAGHGTPHEISDRGMGHLSDFHHLEEFSVKSYHITDQGLATLVDKPIRKLRLCYAAVTATGLRRLPLEALTDLTVEYTKTIGSDLSFLDRCGNLQRLGLRMADVTDDQLRHVGGLTRLQHLDVAHNRPNERFGLTKAITDRGIRRLRSLTNLTTLDLWDTNITSAAAKDLMRLHGLTWLSVGMTGINDRFLKNIDKLPELETLDVSNSTISSSGTRPLTGLPRLRVLRLGHTQVDDAAIDHLLQIPSLEELDLYDTRVTVLGLTRLSSLSNLKRLNIWYLTEDPQEMAKLRETLPGVDIWFEPL